MKGASPFSSRTAACSAASASDTRKKDPNTAFIARNEAAIPLPDRRKSRRLNPSCGAMRSAVARIRASTSRCANV
jgi:hypothetical protein